MASSLPNDILRTASQRFLYNIDLIEKRYANKRPSGLELDVDSGKIIQVVDAKRPRLTAEEAKEKMKKSFLAPPSLFGNSSLCSPFIHDMTTSLSTKKRVLKHNLRFKEQLNDGFDCTSTLFNDIQNVNDNNQASEDNEDAENREEEELFDLDDIFDDDDNDADDEDEEDGDIEDKLSESDEDVGLEDLQNQEFEDELDNEKEYEKEPFEIPEEEAEKEGNSYKDLKITRALIQRLTPKILRRKKTTKALSASSKKSNPLIDGTPKATKKEKDATNDSKKDVAQSTPVRSSKKITKASSSRSVPKPETLTVSKKSTTAASEKTTSKRDVFLVEDETPIKSRGRPRTSAPSTVLKVNKIINTSTNNAIPSISTTESSLKKPRGRPRKSIIESTPMEIAPATVSNKESEESSSKKNIAHEETQKAATKQKKISKAAVEESDSEVPKKKSTSKIARDLSRKSLPLVEAAPKKSRGRPRKSIA